MVNNNSQMSMLEVAIKLMEQKKNPQSIKTIIAETLTLKGIDDPNGDKAAQLYVDITTSSVFVYMGDDNWDLKSRQSLDKWDLDGSAFSSEEDEIDDEAENIEDDYLESDLESYEEDSDDYDDSDDDDADNEEFDRIVDNPDDDDYDYDDENDFDEDDYEGYMDDYENLYDK